MNQERLVKAIEGLPRNSEMGFKFSTIISSRWRNPTLVSTNTIPKYTGKIPVSF
jgi:hypothetical protein